MFSLLENFIKKMRVGKIVESLKQKLKKNWLYFYYNSIIVFF